MDLSFEDHHSTLYVAAEKLSELRLDVKELQFSTLWSFPEILIWIFVSVGLSSTACLHSFPMPRKIAPVASRIARTVYATQHVYDEELFIMDE